MHTGVAGPQTREVQTGRDALAEWHTLPVERALHRKSGDGHAARQRLERAEPEALALRREDIDVSGGEERGDRFNWRYTIDLPVPAADGTADMVRVSFDDWMWLMSDDRLFNRAYMRRASVTLGDVSIFFEKR